MTRRVGRAAAFGSLLLAALLSRALAQPAQESGVRLAGEFLIPPRTSFPGIGSSAFGAISGLATLPGGCDLLAISDDSEDPRIYRLHLSGAGTSMRIRPVERIPLSGGPGAPATLDPEGIAITKTGTLLVSSEGPVKEPRLPPAIVEYSADGQFIRQLPVPARFVPNPLGPLTTGARPNGSFESLTVSADFARFFTANEVPLVQDGPDDAFAAGQRVRIVEYLSENNTYRPAREYAYDIAPLDRPAFAASFSVNGLVELLQVSATELLALERGFVQARDNPLGLNRIRLFRIDLRDATDVSTVESLAAHTDVRPVRKTLVQDFSQLAGRSIRLFNLDNFEGLAWVGPGPGSDRSLLMVSDDNFNRLQLTAFLLLDLAPTPARSPVCP